MRFLNNIESGSTPAFTLPLTDGSNGQVLKTNGSGTVSWENDTSGTDTNYYVSAASFNTSNGELTLTVSGGGSNVVVDLDGRYLTSYTDTNTTYDLAVSAGAANTSVIALTGSDASTDNVTLSGGSNVTITESGNTITIAATDTNTTYTATGGVTLTGTVFSHTDTSSVSDLTAASRTYVTGLTFDTYGHVTGVTTGTETVVNTDTNTTYDLNVQAGAANTSVIRLAGSDSTNDDVTLSGGSNVTISESGNTITIAATDTNTTYSAGNGLDLSGTVFSHEDTSTATDLTASSRTYVTGLTFDTYGHVTGYSTGTETVTNTDTNTTYTMSIPSATTDLKLDASSGTDSTVTFTGAGATTVTRTSATEFTISSTDTNTDTNTTYSTSIPASTTKLRLTGSDSSTDDIEFIGSGATTVTRTDASTFTISSTDTNTDTNTTYDLTVPASTTAIRLAAGGSGSGNDDITISGGGATTVTRVSATELQISSTDTNTDTNTTYDLAVSAGGANTASIDLTAGGSGSGTDSVIISGGTNVTVSESGNTITISSTDTNTDTNYYLDGLTFATGTGVLTASVNGATNQTVDLDGRYYELGIGSAEENVIATYSSGNVMDFATEGNNSIGNQRLMSDGSELGIWNRNWTNKADGAAGALYFWSVATEQATSRAAIGSTEAMSMKCNIAGDTYVAFRNAHSTGYDMHLATRSEADCGFDMYSAASATGAYKTARINSNASGQLEIINYGTNPFHFATARTDANFSWYHGDATTAGGIGSLTNPKSNLNMKLQGISGGTAQLLVNGSNSASTPDYSFIDDTDTGFYYEGTAGNVSFATGGTKTFRFPTTTGTSGQVLQTDGSGNSSWATVSGGGSGTVNSGSAGQVAFYAATGTAVSGDAGMTYNASTDTLSLVGDVIAYASSDARFKDNVKTIPNALDKVSKIGGYTYDWNETAGDVLGRSGSDVGVIAQEVEEVLPEVVKTRENGYKAVNYEKMVALLIEANKELQDVVAQLEERIIDLENK